MNPSKDDGAIAVSIERFTEQRLPRLLRLKDKVDGDERLSDMDINFLKEMFEDSKHTIPLGDRHPG